MTRYTFRKHEHLCGRLRIQEVFSTGKAVNEAPFRLVGKVMELPTVARAQVAFSVPRRYLRHAVDRNRMKRLMREVYRLHKAGYLERIAAADRQCAWLIIYQGRGTMDLAETQLKITRCLDRWMEKHGF
ncbi:MAG: ribonuclease P protein component [Flavobacteriales bacterium]|nr:ribonuclease P protein component [Flavobacteriales bacterium]